MIRLFPAAASLAASLLLVVAASDANAQGAHYVAVPETAARPSVITRSTAWTLRGDRYVANRAPERDLIRRELGMRFSQFPSVAGGLFLRTWRGEPQAGQPKVPPPVRSMLERGLVALRTDRGWTRAYFTPAGLDALREMARDRRLLDPVRYAHVCQELELDAEEADETASAAADAPGPPA